MTIDLRYGDTIEQMKLIADKSIDFICCDLPYYPSIFNDKYKFKVQEYTSLEEAKSVFEKAFQEIISSYRIIKNKV